MTWSNYYSHRDYDLAMLIRLAMSYQKFLDSVILYSNGKRGLEVGTGTGWASIYLSHEQYDIVAIDSDPQILEEAVRFNSRLGGSARFCRMDMFTLAYRAREFNFIFHQGVLEHFPIETIRFALKEQLRVADRVIFAVPTLRYGRKDFGDENLWTRSQWHNILSPFRVLYSFGFNYVNDVAKLLGVAVWHPRYRRNRWVQFLNRANETLFAGEIGFVVQAA